MVFKEIGILLFTLLLSQGISALIDILKGEKISWSFFIKLGGMPSSHSATVSALATLVYLSEGLTLLFLVTVVFAIFIIRDSYGLRYEVGEHGKYLNKKYKTHFLSRVGHTKLEVFVGTVLGILVAIIGHLLL